MGAASARGIPIIRPSELAAIPLELRERPQWVCWRLEERDSKPTKVPYSPATGQRASSTDRRSWAAWLDAVSALGKPGGLDEYDGIGFVFSPDDPYVGIDLDHCRNPGTGEIQEWAAAIIRQLNGYAEVSPSGTGVHIIVRGSLPEGGRRKGQIEMYDRGRYFTVTGRVIRV